MNLKSTIKSLGSAYNKSSLWCKFLIFISLLLVSGNTQLCDTVTMGSALTVSGFTVLNNTPSNNLLNVFSMLQSLRKRIAKFFHNFLCVFFRARCKSKAGHIFSIMKLL